MPAERMNRRRELDRMERSARYRHEEELRRHTEYYDDTWARPNNTLGPNEDVVEKRRKRKHVVLATGTGRTHNILGENLVLLIGLILSIIVLYHACIYVLNQ